jgi:CBS domain-containing protein
LTKVITAAPGEPLTALLERMAAASARRVLVLDTGRVVGIITATDIAKLLDARKLALAY